MQNTNTTNYTASYGASMMLAGLMILLACAGEALTNVISVFAVAIFRNWKEILIAVLGGAVILSFPVFMVALAYLIA